MAAGGGNGEVQTLNGAGSIRIRGARVHNLQNLDVHREFIASD